MSLQIELTVSDTIEFFSMCKNVDIKSMDSAMNTDLKGKDKTKKAFQKLYEAIREEFGESVEHS